MNDVTINLDKERLSYQIRVGHDGLEHIVWAIKKDHPARRYLVITDSEVRAIYGDLLVSTMKRLDLPVAMLDFAAGEERKNMATVLTLIEELLKLGADRSEMIIALGGGVVGDLAGFVASVYLRSLPVIHLPTTLVAQVDSSIGGKTGVDCPQGKNLIGTFYQPRGVFIDTGFLSTLPERQWRGGLAEVVKYGLIAGGDYLALLEDSIPSLKTRDSAVMTAIVEGACRIKKGFVEIDQHDRGVRRFLNLGHTLGHALEAESGFGLSHGEAVALGIRAALGLSQRLYHLPPGDTRRALALMDSLDLPGRIPAGADTGKLLEFIRKDKKKEGATINFVLLKRLGMPFVAADVPETTLIEVIEELKQ